MSILRWNRPKGAAGELEIDNLKPNDAHWSQRLRLQPGWYRFTAEMRAEEVPHDHAGANLSLLEDGIISQALYGSSQWQVVGFDLKVGASAADVLLACRLGGFSSLNRGKAFCRNLVATKIIEPDTQTFPRYELDKIRGAGVSAQSNTAPQSLAEVLPIQSRPHRRISRNAILLETGLDLLDRSAAVLIAGATLIMLIVGSRSH